MPLHFILLFLSSQTAFFLFELESTVYVEIVYVPPPATPCLLDPLSVTHDGAVPKLAAVAVLLQRDSSTSPTNNAHTKHSFRSGV